MKHTKGPWTLTKNGEFINGRDRAELFTPRQATKADIRLCKAAPDMLRALEQVLKALPTELHSKKMVEAFRNGWKVVDKARGEV